MRKAAAESDEGRRKIATLIKGDVGVRQATTDVLVQDKLDLQLIRETGSMHWRGKSLV